MLLEGETAYDRADITCKVFHAKVDSFMHNFRKGKYFGPCHEIVYEVRVIGYQQWGLPHAHLVIQLSSIPDFNRDTIYLTKWIDDIMKILTLPYLLLPKILLNDLRKYTTLFKASWYISVTQAREGTWTKKQDYVSEDFRVQQFSIGNIGRARIPTL